MLFIQNLDEIIFNRHKLIDSDELIIISGYVGPNPIQRLGDISINSRIVYGMYASESIRRPLHDSIINLQNAITNINVFYSNLPVHSKCYAWRRRGQVVYALIGSANFSTNGLSTPYKETLAEITTDTFSPLNNYIELVLNNSISCLEVSFEDAAEELPPPIAEEQPVPGERCLLTLLGRGREVQNIAGLNWGQNPNNHTNPNDSYIKIRRQDVNNFPKLFPPKQDFPIRTRGRGRAHRHNDAIEIIWDDGTVMDGILFGNQTIEGVVYPKQVGSFPQYKIMGIYLRERIGVPLGQPIRRAHLDTYGRTNVEVTLLSEGVYRFDISV